MDYDEWPMIPPLETFGRGIRLPSDFVDLVSSRLVTNDEIGRILRCIVLKTDFFITPRIEPEVFRIRQAIEKRERLRERVRACRKRCGVESSGDGGQNPEPAAEGVAATPQGGDTILEEKTPPPLKEKKPPIIPLEKKDALPLEKRVARKKKTSSESISEGMQMTLFSIGGSAGSGGVEPPPAENAPGCCVPLPVSNGCEDTPKDIESDSSGRHGVISAVPSGKDSRADAAWIPARFAAFWAQYPKKVSKQAALKAFTKIIKAQPDVDRFMRTLIASLNWWKGQDSWTKDGGKFIPHPATWLNRGGWQDSEDNQDTGSAQFLGNGESDEELMKRLTGG